MVTDTTLDGFLEALASKAPVPGGGGASAVTAAAGVALAEMVCNLTLGKRRYADVQDRIGEILADCQTLRAELLALADQDAAAFEPLSRAYGLPSATEDEARHKEVVLEAALLDATVAPLAIMERADRAIDLHAELFRIGSRIMLSDVGVGVGLCEAALRGAALNVYANTSMMRDRSKALELEGRTRRLSEAGCERAGRVSREVEEALTCHES